MKIEKITAKMQEAANISNVNEIQIGFSISFIVSFIINHNLSLPKAKTIKETSIQSNDFNELKEYILSSEFKQIISDLLNKKFRY